MEKNACNEHAGFTGEGFPAKHSACDVRKDAEGAFMCPNKIINQGGCDIQSTNKRPGFQNSGPQMLFIGSHFVKKVPQMRDAGDYFFLVNLISMFLNSLPSGPGPYISIS